MLEKDIIQLVLDYIDNNLTDIQAKELEERFVNDTDFSNSFKEYLKVYRNYRQLGVVQNTDKNLAWSKIATATLEKKPDVIPIKTHRHLFQNYKLIAASILLLITIGLGIKWYSYSHKTIDALVIPNDQIVLINEDGKTQILNSKAENKISSQNGKVIGVQKQGLLSYFNLEKAEKLSFSTIKIPFGKRFNVILSDGTKVYLNSGSTLRYPQQFLANQKTRDVQISGEAYFEVAKNPQKPFRVYSDLLKVQVLGTHFNMRSYTSENKSEVVLTEGAVKVFLKDSLNKTVIPIQLSPGEMASYSKDGKFVEKQNVFVKNYVGWVDGQLIYRNASFSFIIKDLERHFNVQIENKSKLLNSEKMNMNFGSASLAKVMQYLKTDFGLDYHVSNNTIILE